MSVHDLWIDAFKPVADLAIHAKKVQQVSDWLVHALKPSTRHPGILCLTGPSGSGKTACIDVLAREMDVSVFEYENAYNDKTEWQDTASSWQARSDSDTVQISLSKHFQEFILNASKSSALSFGKTCSDKTSALTAQRKLILVEDHPNIMSRHTQITVHNTLRILCNTSSVPLVVILSDTNLDDKEAISIRNYFPPDLLSHVHEINFNPVAVTIVKKCLKNVVRVGKAKTSSWDRVINAVSDGCLGDLRCAINTLQFYGVSGEADITSRDRTSMLFSVCGTLLNQKGKDELSSASTVVKNNGNVTKGDAVRDVDGIIAESHLDSGSIHLFLQQNYLGYLQSIEDALTLAELMSCSDLLVTRPFDCLINEASIGGSGYADSCISRGFMHLERSIVRSFKPLEKSGYWDAMKEAKRRATVVDSYLMKRGGASESRCSSASVFCGRGEYLRDVLPYMRVGKVKSVYADVSSFKSGKRWKKEPLQDTRDDTEVSAIDVDEIDEICEFESDG